MLAHRPDVGLCDVRMPPSGADEGLRAAHAVRRAWPGAAVVLLSQYVEVAYADDLLATGVERVGYVLKDRVADTAHLCRTLDDVAGGGTVLDPDVVARLMARRRDPVAALTPREHDVMTLMAQGLSNAAVAAALHVTEGGVEKHTQRIFAKLGLAPDDGGTHRRVRAVLDYLRATV